MYIIMPRLTQIQLAGAFGVTWISRKDGLRNQLDAAIISKNLALQPENGVRFRDEDFFQFLSHIFTALDSAGYMISEYERDRRPVGDYFYWYQINVPTGHDLHASFIALRNATFFCNTDTYQMQSLWNVMKVFILMLILALST